MSNVFKDGLSVIAPGLTLTSTASANVTGTIPTAQSGEVPKYVRVATTAPTYVMLFASNVGSPVASNTGMLVSPGDAVVMQVHQYTKWAAKSVSGDSVINMVPLENM